MAVAKRCITGTAKTFFNSLPKVTSWHSFQNFFLDEFEQKFTSADIHKLLSDRRLRKGENCTEYLIKMREIAAKASIDEKSLCQYVIQGIPNSPNKLILYGCDSIRELKQKLLIFESIDKTYNTASQTHYDFSRRSFGPTQSGLVSVPSFNKFTPPNEQTFP